MSALGPESVGSTVVGAIRATLERIGFWTAVTMPLGYVYFFVNGVMAADPIRFVGLLGLHIAALVVGRGYKVRAAAERHVSSYRDGGDEKADMDESSERLEPMLNTDG